MKVTSWNVQGLGGPFYKRMRGRLRLELQKALIGDPIDILLIWHIWKARCHRLLGKAFVPIAEIVSLIWQEMVLTLKARFDAIKGDSDAAMTRRNAFHRLWGKMGFYLIHRYSVRWMFSPPRSTSLESISN